MSFLNDYILKFSFIICGERERQRERVRKRGEIKTKNQHFSFILQTTVDVGVEEMPKIFTVYYACVCVCVVQVGCVYSY